MNVLAVENENPGLSSDDKTLTGWQQFFRFPFQPIRNPGDDFP